MTRTRIIVLVCFLAVAALAIVSSSAAHHEQYDSIFKTNTPPMSNNCNGNGSGLPAGGLMICLNDNASMSFWLAGGMTTAEKNLVRNVLSNEYNDTDLNPQEVFPPNIVWNAAGTAETDLIMDEVNLQGEPHNFPADFYGIAWCEDEYGIERCDQSYAFLDEYPGNIGPTYFTANACHEIGHTVGLTHTQQAYQPQTEFDSDFRCMNSGLIIGDLGWTGPGDHNKWMINTEY